LGRHPRRHRQGKWRVLLGMSHRHPPCSAIISFISFQYIGFQSPVRTTHIHTHTHIPSPAHLCAPSPSCRAFGSVALFRSSHFLTTSSTTILFSIITISLLPHNPHGQSLAERTGWAGPSLVWPCILAPPQCHARRHSFHALWRE
jgi:hypothetical protein